MKVNEEENKVENRVLGRTLSVEDLEDISAGSCTPSKDGCANPDGSVVDCPV